VTGATIAGRLAASEAALLDAVSPGRKAARALNPVLYTIAGPHGQAPVDASFVRERPPALVRALRGMAEADPGGRPARLTSARRERNRIADAIAAATAATAASPDKETSR
jgi:hypothetical protein